MGDWAHGYNISQGYTFGFHREMGADWLDLSAMAAGFMPPRRGAAGGYRYLDLGCGQGFGLCLLAAANPRAEFVGIDFSAAHVAHARDLAHAGGLSNVRFLEADFTDLAANWPAEVGAFDYAVMHGILSWVPPQVREAVQACLRAAVLPGGLVYASYNAQPGWVSTLPLQHMMQRLQTVTKLPGPEAIDRSIALFDAMFQQSPLAQTLPMLKTRVDAIRGEKRSYLVHEYLHENWRPFWFSEVARDMASAKLDFVGTATAIEQVLPGILPPPMRELVTAQPDAAFAQEVLDCVTGQSFRRDLFCRGARRSSLDGTAALMATTFHRTAATKPQQVTVSATFGEMMLQPEVFGPVLDALEDGGKTLAQIAALPAFRGATPANVVQSAMLLIQAGLVAPAPRAPIDTGLAPRFNAAVARAICGGASYEYLAAPLIASALPAGEVDGMLIDAFLAEPGADRAALATGLRQRLDRLGRKLGQEGKPLEGSALDQRAAELAEEFLSRKLTAWRAFGALA